MPANARCRWRTFLRFGRLTLAVAAILSLMLASNQNYAQEQEMPLPQNSDEAGSGARPSPSIEFPHLPKLIVKPMPSYGTAPMFVGFFVTNANPQSGQFVSYRWTFGDGTFSTLPPTMFFHKYTKPGSYIIEVTGTTANGLNSTGVAGVIVR
jgi:hypothetical protein